MLEKTMPEPDELEETPTAEVVPPTSDPVCLRVSARQFTIARGKRWERSAGFLFWAGEKFGAGTRKPIQEWTGLWDEFWAIPNR